MLLAVVLVPVIAWLVRGWWLEPWLARYAGRELSRILGGTVTIEQLHGSWWRDASLHGLQGSALELGPLHSLEVDEAHVTYGWGLFRGDMSAIRTVTVSGATLTLDVRDNKPKDGPDDSGWAPFLAKLPQPLPDIHLTGDFVVLLEAGEIRAREIRIAAKDDRIELTIAAISMPWIDNTPGLTCTVLVGADGRLTLENPCALGSLATLRTFSLRADVTEQGMHLTAEVATGEVQVAVAPGTWSVDLKHGDLAHLPPSLAAPWKAALPADLGGLVDLHLAAAENGFTWSTHVRQGRLSPVVVATADLSGSWQEGTWAIDQVAIDSGEGQQVRGQEVRIGRDGQRSGTITVEASDLRPILRRLRDTTWIPSAPISLRTQLSAVGSGVSIEGLAITAPGLEVIGVGTWSGPEAANLAIAATVTTDLAAISATVPAIDAWAGTLHADLNIEGSLHALSELEIRATATGEDVQLGGTPIPALDFQLTNRGDHLSLDARAEIAEHRVQVVGNITLADDGGVAVDFSTLEVRRDTVLLRNEQPLRAQWNPHSWSVDPCRFLALDGQLAFRGTGDDDLISASIEANDIHLDRIPGLTGVAGALDCRIQADGPLTAPLLLFHITSRDLIIGNRPSRIAVEARQDGTGIHIQHTQVSLGDTVTVNISGLWPVTVGVDGAQATGARGAGAHLHSDIAALDKLFPNWFTQGRVSCSATITPDATGNPELQATFAVHDAVVVKIEPYSLSQRPSQPPHLDLSAEIHANSRRGRVKVEARVDNAVVCRGTLNSRWQRPVLDSPIDGTIDLSGADLASLAHLSSEIVRLIGQIEGSLAISGTLREPEVEGALRVTDAELKLAADVPTIATINGSLLIDGSQTAILDLAAEMGYAPVRITGPISLVKGVPRLDLTITADNALMVQNRDLRVRISTTDLTLTGPLTALHSAGTILIDSGLWSRPIDLIGTGSSRAGIDDGRFELFSLRNPPLSDLTFDLTIRTSAEEGQGLRLQNNIVSALCQVDLHLGGTGLAPQPRGSIISLDARVTLPFSILILERVELTFPEDDPFRPTIDLLGSSQVRQWRVVVQASGTIDDVGIEANAPGLTSEDAVLLLSTGGTRAELNDPDGQRALLSRVGTFVGLELVRAVRGPADPDAKESILDRWSLEYGREVSRDGQETIDAEIRLNPYRERTGYILYGQRDRYDEFNIGIIMRIRFGGENP